jgi:nifR3 family TIM-barrel protein
MMPADSEIYPADSVVMAPLSGYTDLPFRRACWRHGCRYAFTPLVEAGSVVYRNPRSKVFLLRGEDEPWLGLQLLGSSPKRLGRAMHILRDRQFEVVDLNMGCPVKKVTRRGAGVALCYAPDIAVECLQAIMNETDLPVTAKIRVLDGQNPHLTVVLAEKLAATGIRALTIHGRTWEQVYSGPVAAHVIREVADSLDIPVIANGGVVDRESCQQLRADSGCSRVMVARGAIGNPWLFRELTGEGGLLPPSHAEICAELKQHVLEMLELYGERAGMKNARKIILAYLVGRGYRRTRRATVTGLATQVEFEAFLAELAAEGPSPQFAGIEVS